MGRCVRAVGDGEARWAVVSPGTFSMVSSAMTSMSSTRVSASLGSSTSMTPRLSGAAAPYFHGRTGIAPGAVNTGPDGIEACVPGSV